MVSYTPLTNSYSGDIDRKDDGVETMENTESESLAGSEILEQVSQEELPSLVSPDA